MKALVIYDTFFGNTQQIAESIGAALGEALGAGAEVHTLRVTDVQPEHLAGVGLLIVGSPTRAFKPSPATTAWLKALPADSLKGVQVARLVPVRVRSIRLTPTLRRGSVSSL